jgi:hypothetical protein
VWIPRYVREYRLYVLVVAQLSDRLAGPIYMGGIKHPTIILEVVSSHDRWIWHTFFDLLVSTMTSM